MKLLLVVVLPYTPPLLCWSTSTKCRSSSNACIFCCAYSCDNGNFFNVACVKIHGSNSGHIIRTPLIKFANRWAISLWHKRCFDVGHGNWLIRENSSDNCGFSPSHRVSMSSSWIVFKLSNWNEIKKNDYLLLLLFKKKTCRYHFDL